MTKVALRNAWFQAHKWIGLILAAAIIPICITGSALVWDEALDGVLNPQRHVGGRLMLTPAAYAESARAALGPGERLAELRFPADGEGPVVASAARAPAPGAGRPVRTQIWLAPGDAAVLDRAASNAGAIRVMHVIHGSLMVPGGGRQIVGWIGVAMLVSCVSGLWLWWPTVGHWARGLRWRRHRNFDTNLHHLMGFWIAVPLAVLSITGVWISFPGVFNANARPAGAARPAGPDPRAAMRARPLAETRLDPAAAIARARVDPAKLASIAWPTDMQGSWTIAARGRGERPDQVKVDDATGAVERAGRSENGGAGGTSRLMRRIHDGNGTGPVWQTVVFLGGLLPTALAITGVIMWSRARGWRGRLKHRRAAQLMPAE